MRFEYSAGVFIYRINNEGKLLFLLLIKENGEYDIPKGHIEKGERSEDAARREAREETGLDLSLIPWFSVSTRYFFYHKRERIFKQVRFLLASTEKAGVKISKEHKGYEWLGYDEAFKKIKFKDLREIFPVVLEYIKRYREMEGLNNEYASLPSSRRNWELSRRFVPGEGPLNAKIMIIGQAPGRFEDSERRPFVGRSGMLLNKQLGRIRIKREKAYIASVVQFYPPGNKMPTKEESSLCLPFLKRQIAIVKPRFAILLGNLASTKLLGIGNVEQNHGKILGKDGIRYMVTFHPAAALRFKRIDLLMTEDFKKFKKEIG